MRLSILMPRSTTNLSIALKDAIEQIRTSKKPIAVGQDCHDAIVQLYSLPDSVLFNDSDSSIDALLSSAQVLNNTVWEEERNLCMETALRVIDSTEMNQRRFRVKRFKLLIDLGQVYQRDSLASRALENYMKAESLYSSLATSEREDLKAEYVSTCINIFNLLKSSNYADAIVYVEKAVRVMEGLEESIDTEDLFLMYEMMATLYQYYMDSGHEELAAEYGKKTLQVCPLFSPGWNKDTLKDLAEFMLKLGEFQYSTERYEDAVQTYELFIRRFYDPQKAHSDVVNRAYYAILSRMESMYTSLSRSADAERVKKTMISIEEKKNNTSVQTHQ